MELKRPPFDVFAERRPAHRQPSPLPADAGHVDIPRRAGQEPGDRMTASRSSWSPTTKSGPRCRRTSGSSAMRPMATRRCSRARTPWRRRWRIVDPVLNLTAPPLRYRRGTWGPKAAEGLIPRASTGSGQSQRVRSPNPGSFARLDHIGARSPAGRTQYESVGATASFNRRGLVRRVGGPPSGPASRIRLERSPRSIRAGLAAGSPSPPRRAPRSSRPPHRGHSLRRTDGSGAPAGRIARAFHVPFTRIRPAVQVDRPRWLIDRGTSHISRPVATSAQVRAAHQVGPRTASSNRAIGRGARRWIYRLTRSHGRPRSSIPLKIRRDAMLRTVAATLMAIILVSACSAASSPAPSSGTSPAASTSFDPSAITGTAILSGWQSSPAEGNALTQTLLRLPVGLSQRQGRLPAAGWRLRRRHGGQVRLGRRPRRVLRRRWLRPAVDRPGLPGAARRLHRQVGLRYDPVLRRLRLDLQGRRRQDLRPAEGRQHDRDGLQHGPRPNATQDHGRAGHAGRVAEGQERPQGTALPEPGTRPRARLPVRAGRLAAVRGRQDRADRHAGLEGRGPVVHGSVQERSRDERGRHR